MLGKYYSKLIKIFTELPCYRKVSVGWRARSSRMVMSYYAELAAGILRLSQKLVLIERDSILISPCDYCVIKYSEIRIKADKP